jgi:hypothetical protein
MTDAIKIRALRPTATTRDAFRCPRWHLSYGPLKAPRGHSWPLVVLHGLLFSIWPLTVHCGLSRTPQALVAHTCRLRPPRLSVTTATPCSSSHPLTVLSSLLRPRKTTMASAALNGPPLPLEAPIGLLKHPPAFHGHP